MEKQLKKMREHLSDLVSTAADCNDFIDQLMDPDRRYSLTMTRLRILTASAEYMRQEIHRLENLIQEVRDPQEHEAAEDPAARIAEDVATAADSDEPEAS